MRILEFGVGEGWGSYVGDGCKGGGHGFCCCWKAADTRMAIMTSACGVDCVWSGWGETQLGRKDVAC